MLRKKPVPFHGSARTSSLKLQFLTLSDFKREEKPKNQWPTLKKTSSYIYCIFYYHHHQDGRKRYSFIMVKPSN